MDLCQSQVWIMDLSWSPPSPPKRYTITLSYLNKGKHDLMTVKPTEINVPWFPAQGLGGAFSFPSQ